MTLRVHPIIVIPVYIYWQFNCALLLINSAENEAKKLILSFNKDNYVNTRTHI